MAHQLGHRAEFALGLDAGNRAIGQSGKEVMLGGGQCACHVEASVLES